jgi:ribonuclease HII
VLIDGRIKLPKLNISQQSIIRGDSQSLSIAAASIIAKVTRDRKMLRLDRKHPDYKFAQHKGYGTQFHRDTIAEKGPCPIHRLTFAPIRQEE